MIRAYLPALFLLLACEPNSGAPAQAVATPPPSGSVAHTAVPQAALDANASCQAVRQTFQMHELLGIHIRLYGFPESLGPSEDPIIDGTIESNQQRLTEILTAYDRVRPTLEASVQRSADTFASTVRKRATHLAEHAKRLREERQLDPASPQAKALRGPECFGMMAMLTEECPQRVFFADMKEFNESSKPLETLCGSHDLKIIRSLDQGARPGVDSGSARPQPE